MLRILFTQSGQRVDDVNTFDDLWRELLEFKKLDKPRKSPNLIGLQDDRKRLFLLALHDEDHWVLEALEEDWGTQFGKIDLAKDFDVKEELLDDAELRKTLDKLMTE